MEAKGWDRADELIQDFEDQVKSRRKKSVITIFTQVVNMDLIIALVHYWDGSDEKFNLRDGVFYPQKPEN